jgi:hypothetical protein
MSTRRTPPKFASNPDLATATGDANINMRKRKQPDIDDIDQRFALMEKKFDSQLADQSTMMDKVISETIAASIQSAISSEFSKYATLLDRINDNVSALRSDHSIFKETLENVNSRLMEIESSLNASAVRQDTFDKQLHDVKSQMQQSSGLPTQMQKLEHKLLTMEQQARDCNIEIVNIPDRRNENLISIITNLGGVTKQPILQSEIVAVHRVPHADQKDSRPKNIVVKFTTRVLRDNVITASRSIKDLTTEHLGISGHKQKIYVNEHLTLQNKHLFRECRNKAKAQNYKYIWVKHGVILLRKTDTSPVLAVRTEQDFIKIK